MLHCSIELPHLKVALTDYKVDISHANVISVYFMQGHHIIVDGCLQIFFLIEAIAHGQITLLLFRARAVAVMNREGLINQKHLFCSI